MHYSYCRIVVKNKKNKKKKNALFVLSYCRIVEKKTRKTKKKCPTCYNK